MTALPVIEMAARQFRWPSIPGSALVVQQLTLWIGMLGGMLAGVAVLVWLWATNGVAWTWYAFIGATVTGVVALVLARGWRLFGPIAPAVRPVQ